MYVGRRDEKSRGAFFTPHHRARWEQPNVAHMRKKIGKANSYQSASRSLGWIGTTAMIAIAELPISNEAVHGYMNCMKSLPDCGLQCSTAQQ